MSDDTELRRRLPLAELSNAALMEEVRRHKRISKKRLEDIRKLKRRIGHMEARLDARH